MARGKEKTTGGIRLRDYHTKTEYEFIYVCTVFDKASKTVKENERIKVPKKMPLDKAEKYINKHYDLTVLEVVKMEVVKTLYGVSNEVWDANRVNLTEMMGKEVK